MKTLINILTALLKSARMLGIRDEDLKSAQDFLNHHEFGLCFDTIVTQMYEYDIEIDTEFYKLIDKIGNKLNLPPESYSMMEDLIRDDNKIPKPVKEELARIITGLK